MKIPFCKPFLTGRESGEIGKALAGLHLSGDGPYTQRCQGWLEAKIGCRKALLTQSCTAALEMAAILCNIGPGDEVIVPSFTFSSTANAFVLRGATPVFVDIRPDTLNIDERLLEGAITPRTKAIAVVHYAGVACEMDAILEIARRHRLRVIEDAAQAIGSQYRGRPLGGFGDVAALSFQQTKNIVCGEGGALLINAPDLVERAEIVWEKGTNRRKFYRGEVDKYTWVDIGSSYLPSEVTAAFLWAQLEAEREINERRLHAWNAYHERLSPDAGSLGFSMPVIPPHCGHNAHIYYVLLRDLETRTRLMRDLSVAGISAVFHYVPLHTSPAGRRFGRTHGELPVTDRVADTLLRLPLWVGVDEYADLVTGELKASLGRASR
ncbi:MAG TPA: dTDP-4-amino-4,6-dideoxygalactose transaminase [Burkholderiales bacterium]|nr:dTDP-4-amino-4,6-dideoxygalactose transaminase [Burkholderiales bacterium]